MFHNEEQLLEMECLAVKRPGKAQKGGGNGEAKLFDIST